jgi:diguanylate cyclase (GGDEF)-like protein/PAS domain S-box-containing protein
MVTSHPNVNVKSDATKPANPHQLRDRAEASLLKSALVAALPADLLCADKTHRLINELQVHQIELEMQNEELRNAQLALALVQAHYFDLFDLAPVGYVTLDAKGLLLQGNLKAAQMLGVARHALPMRPISGYILKSDQDIYYRHRARLLASGEAQAFELRLLKADVGPFWAHLTLSADQTVAGAPVLRLMVSDISARKLLDNRLRVSEAALAAISQGVLITGADQRILSCNKAFSAITGYGEDEMHGLDCRFLQGPLSSPAVIASMHQAICNQVEFSGEILNYCKDGSTFWNELTISPVFDLLGELTHFVGVTRDATLRHVLEDKVRQMAFYDELTQLPNRRLINDRLTQTMALSKRHGNFCALMVLDLDNFKAINDLHGHLVGDLLLMEVARRLTHCVREVDTVGRFGGDEFIVLLGELSASREASTAMTATIAEKIRQNLAEPYLLLVSQPGHADSLVTHHCSASIGVLVFADNEASASDIVKRADAAMYQAKDQGRNRVAFDTTA